MLSAARGVPQGVRRADAESRISTRPDGSQEILQSIRWMHREHVKDLRGLGYSSKEAFWLDFACLPFLPWDKAAGPEMRLSTILRLYAEIHRSTVGPLESVDAQSFLDLLRQRYRTIRQRVAESRGPAPQGADRQTPADPRLPAGDSKETLASLIVMRTAREWGQHRSAFPCKLVEDI